MVPPGGRGSAAFRCQAPRGLGSQFLRATLCAALRSRFADAGCVGRGRESEGMGGVKDFLMFSLKRI